MQRIVLATLLSALSNFLLIISFDSLKIFLLSECPTIHASTSIAFIELSPVKAPVISWLQSCIPITILGKKSVLFFTLLIEEKDGKIIISLSTKFSFSRCICLMNSFESLSFKYIFQFAAKIIFLP